MQCAIKGLDHLIVGVRDLEAARTGWARLGFNSTPRGRHIGWATGNYCIMFAHDYLELLGIVEPGAFSNGFDRRLEEEGEGLLGLALASDDPDRTAAAWRAAGLASASPQPLTRLIESETPAVELRFTNVTLDLAETLGLNLFTCVHLTPEPMRRPAWVRHPNGAVGIKGLTIIADALAPLEAFAARLVGSAALTRTDRVVAVQTGTCPILLATPEDAGQLYPGFDFPERMPEPRLAVMEIGVADTAAAAGFLDRQGVPHERDSDGAVLVAPEDANGVRLVFVQA